MLELMITDQFFSVSFFSKNKEVIGPHIIF